MIDQQRLHQTHHHLHTLLLRSRERERGSEAIIQLILGASRTLTASHLRRMAWVVDLALDNLQTMPEVRLRIQIQAGIIDSMTTSLLGISASSTSTRALLQATEGHSTLDTNLRQLLTPLAIKGLGNLTNNQQSGRPVKSRSLVFRVDNIAKVWRLAEILVHQPTLVPKESDLEKQLAQLQMQLEED